MKRGVIGVVLGSILLTVGCKDRSRDGAIVFPTFELEVAPGAATGSTLYALEGAQDRTRLYRAEPYGVVGQPGTDWTEITPPGVFFVGSVTADPTTPDRVFALGVDTTSLRLFRSDDRGTTWVALTTGFPAGAGYYPACVRVDPTTANRVWVGLRVGAPATGAALFRSDDGGNTWAGLAGYPEAAANEIVFHPTDPAIRMVRSAAAIHRTTDAGQTWTLDVAGLPNTRNVRDLTADPSTPDRYYAVVLDDTSGVGVYRRTAGTWVELTSARALTYVEPGTSFTSAVAALRLIVDPVDPNRLFVGTSRGLFVSDDGGATWTQRTDGIAGFNLTVLDVAFDGASVLMGTSQTLFVSPTTSLNWSALNGNGLEVRFYQPL